MNRNIRGRKAFTLIELLVVVLILGILVAVALPSYMGSLKNSRTNTANNNARAIATAVKAAQVKTGSATLVAAAAALTDGDVLTEIGAIPVNPCTGNTTGYTVSGGGAAALTIQADTSGSCNATAPYTVYP